MRKRITTALTEYINWINSIEHTIQTDAGQKVLSLLKDKATSLLNEEKRNLIESHIDGQQVWSQGEDDNIDDIAEHNVNIIFKQKLIAEMSEAIENNSYHPIDSRDLPYAAKSCAEIAINNMPKWFKIKEEPLNESGWLEVITNDGTTANYYYDENYKHNLWETGVKLGDGLPISSVLLYRYIII